MRLEEFRKKSFDWEIRIFSVERLTGLIVECNLRRVGELSSLFSPQN